MLHDWHTSIGVGFRRELWIFPSSLQITHVRTAVGALLLWLLWALDLDAAAA